MLLPFQGVQINLQPYRWKNLAITIGLLLALPDVHDLAADSHDVEHGNDEEQQQAQADGWQHGALGDVWEDGLD